MFYSVLVLSLVALRTSEEFAGCTKGTFLMCSSGDNGAIEPTTLNKAMDDNQATWKCEKNIFNPEDDEFVSVISAKREVYVSLFWFICVYRTADVTLVSESMRPSPSPLPGMCISKIYIQMNYFLLILFFSISFLRGYRTISAI